MSTARATALHARAAKLRAELVGIEAQLAGEVPTTWSRAQVRDRRFTLARELAGLETTIAREDRINAARRLDPAYGTAVERYEDLVARLREIDHALTLRPVNAAALEDEWLALAPAIQAAQQAVDRAHEAALAQGAGKEQR
jgi:hypothetical protein